MSHQPHGVTRESIEAAKAAMWRERAAIMRAVPGLVIREDGTIAMPRAKAKRPKRWHCVSCARAWHMDRLDCQFCGGALSRAH